MINLYDFELSKLETFLIEKYNQRNIVQHNFLNGSMKKELITLIA